MHFEWDDGKNDRNVAKHGLNFMLAHDFVWHDAVIFDRSHSMDGEQRFVAVGLLNGKYHTIVFTRRGAKTRIISLRCANKQEESVYEKNT